MERLEFCFLVTETDTWIRTLPCITVSIVMHCLKYFAIIYVTYLSSPLSPVSALYPKC